MHTELWYAAIFWPQFRHSVFAKELSGRHICCTVWLAPRYLYRIWIAFMLCEVLVVLFSFAPFPWWQQNSIRFPIQIYLSIALFECDCQSFWRWMCQVLLLSKNSRHYKSQIALSTYSKIVLHVQLSFIFGRKLNIYHKFCSKIVRRIWACFQHSPNFSDNYFFGCLVRIFLIQNPASFWASGEVYRGYAFQFELGPRSIIAKNAEIGQLQYLSSCWSMSWAIWILIFVHAYPLDPELFFHASVLLEGKLVLREKIPWGQAFFRNSHPCECVMSSKRISLPLISTHLKYLKCKHT